MSKRSEKLNRLADISRLYYEKDKTQSEIARQYDISRPMVSKLLKEAKELGIVRIHIQIPSKELQPQSDVMAKARNVYGIHGGRLVTEGENDQETNHGIACAAIEYLEELGGDSLGIGWGHIIGDMVSALEQSVEHAGIGSCVCPLIGNGGVGLKNYHSNELVRVIAEHSRATPEFIYSPAIVLSEQELKLTKELDNYRALYQVWSRLDVALVNIGNFPSVPDFASEARYGDILVREKAVGRILNYFVDRNGRILSSDTDFAIQIPLDLLGRIKCVVGICSANTRPEALKGAMESGYIKHVIAPEYVMKKALEL